MDDQLRNKVRDLLIMLLEATEMQGVKAWALSVAFKYATEIAPSMNKAEIWRYLKDTYRANLRLSYPDQEDPSQSYRRAGGDAWENFVTEYLNANPKLRSEGIRVVRLTGDDFCRLMSRLGLADRLRPRDVDRFLQGIDPDGMPQIFGALFPKASYAERIRADEVTSRLLMEKDLWSATVTLDARNELGTEEQPSVKRQTINRGGFHACYSVNDETVPGGRIHTVDLRQRGIRTNPLIGGIIHAWRDFQARQEQGPA